MTGVIVAAVLAVLAIIVLSIIYFCGSSSQEPQRRKIILDPLDNFPLVDPVVLEIPTPSGNPVRLKVNRKNARKFKKHGPRAFPGFAERLQGRSSRSGVGYYCETDGGFDLVDWIILYELLFANDGYCDLQESWVDNGGSDGTFIDSSSDGLTADGSGADFQPEVGVPDFSPSTTYEAPTPSYESSSYDSGSSSSFDSGGGGGDCGGGGGGGD